jgi:hypothetical protein
LRSKWYLRSTKRKKKRGDEVRGISYLKLWVWAVSIMLLMFPLYSAKAALVFDIGYKFNGDGTMYNPGPWMNITFVDVSPGVVDMTITNVGLAGGEKVKSVYLNLDPNLNPALLAFSDPTITGNVEVDSISKGIDSYQANGDGLYDILIEFNTDGPNKAFNGGEAVEYTISLSGLTASSFDFVSAEDGGVGQYKVATHINSPSDVDGTSVWATIPEPATIALLGLGAIALLRKHRT